MKNNRTKIIGLTWITLASLSALSHAEDWPTFQHDNHRSARSTETLSAARLAEQWVHRSPRPPQPAWDAPAKWDAYAGIRGLKSMRNYDPAFHATVVGQSLFFGSSTDDSVHCLDTRTGQEKWVFTTDGAVRIAPAYSDGRVYFGSDDGYAYCLDAKEGRLIWKFSPSPKERLIINDGKFIPFWPCRTGVLVDEGTAYFAMGMLPWKESYLCAVDASSGEPVGAGRYVKRIEKVTVEGALLASSQKLISPQGRVPPLLFNRKDGAPLGALEGGGGCFVLLTEDDRILHGPGNKTGWIQESSGKDRSKLANFAGGNALVVRGNTAYMLTDKALMALDRTSRKEIWSQPGNVSLALIMAGDILYAGGTDRVAAFSALDGQPLWQSDVSGRAHGLAVADGALFVSTDEGILHCFRPSDEKRPGMPAKKVETPPTVPATQELKLATGPLLRFVGADRAVVEWQTAESMPTRIKWGIEGAAPQTFEDEKRKTQHTATLTGLKRDRVYSYTILSGAEGQANAKAVFECDTGFNYNPPALPDQPSPFPSDARSPVYANAAMEILVESGVNRGMALVLDCGEGRLAYELARQSDLNIVGVDTDVKKVETARQFLRKAGVYGTRITIHHITSLADLPYTRQFANLVVSDRSLQDGSFPASAAEVTGYLRPYGGVALIGKATGSPSPQTSNQLKSWLAGIAENDRVTTGMRGTWARIVRGAARDAGEWSHEYGTAANSAFAGESLNGASKVDDLEVQWLGRPGPRVQPDRSGRKPAPLATNGRLFVQGLQRLLALDAFNGTILWTREIPPMQRFNVPRDCSNWCADDHHVYAAVNNQCWRLDAETGNRSQLYPVIPGTREGWQYDWGFLSAQGNKVIGSAVKQGTAFTEYWGDANAGWYDATKGPATDKVCSENIFALDQQSGKEVWRYRSGMIINSSITIAAGRVYFIESRHPKVKASETHRIGLPELWEDLYLVALDVGDGKVIWEKPIKPAVGQVAVYLAYGQDKLVLICTGNKSYYVYSFNGATGESTWNTEFAWVSDNHGGHMSRPAIVGGKLYVRPKTFDLQTGKVLAQTIPGGGCGTYAATSKALFFRSGNVTVWDAELGTTSSWNRLRPDCWLSTIPAQGLLLSPEAGGGCSCGSWMETSIAFAPKNRQ